MFRRELTLTPDGRACVARAGPDLFDGPSAPDGREPGFDFERAKLILRRNRWLISPASPSSFCRRGPADRDVTPIYRATASVQLEQQSTRVIKDDGVQPEASVNYADAERFLQTQVDILHSRSLAVRVAERLQLFRGTDFLDAMGVSTVPKGTPMERARSCASKVITTLRRQSADRAAAFLAPRRRSRSAAATRELDRARSPTPIPRR